MISTYSSTDICNDIKKFESELKDVASRILYKYGNSYVNDVVQETYIEASTIYYDSLIEFKELKRGVIEICEQISFGYYNRERKNLAKPIGTFNVSEAWTSKGDAWLWETIEDNSGDPLKKLEILDEIQEIKQYKGKWLSFENAKEYVHGLQLKSVDEWNKYASNGKLRNLPQKPDEVYNKFTTWEDFLNLKQEIVIENLEDNIEKYYKEKYLPYNEALTWANNTLTQYRLTELKWKEYIAGNDKKLPLLPVNIPPDPHIVYKKSGWQSYYIWLGASKYYGQLYKATYHTCLEWVKKNASFLKNKNQWKDFVEGKYPIKKPDFIPDRPDIVFRGIGWYSWDTFLISVNGTCQKYRDNIFHSSAIKILYMGVKIWVNPVSVFKNTITATTITVFSPVPPGTIIQVHSSDILNFQDGISEKRTKQILKEKYKMIV